MRSDRVSLLREEGVMLGLTMTMLRPDRGVFPNGMTYARLGDGPKTLLWLASGTKGPMLAMMTRAVRPFVADGYRVCLVSGRPDMPAGHTLEDMADDYAALIAEEFDGRVDLVIGHSTGAQLLLPNIRLPGMATVLGTLLARAALAEHTPEDLLVSAEATHAFDPQKVLPSIGVPVLLVAGEKDVWFTPQAAHLIPNCTLRHYPDTNHFGAITSPRFAADTLDFIRQHQ